MVIRLVVIAPESKKGSFAVRLPIVVGRSDEAKFRIQQDRVSRKHCEFFAQDGVVHLRDLGSTNGTFLDNEQMAAGTSTPVSSGGTVRVGSLVFRVEYESRGEPQTTIAPAQPTAEPAAGPPSASGTVSVSGTVPIGRQPDEDVVGLHVETTHTNPPLDDAAFEPLPEDSSSCDAPAATPEAQGIVADEPGPAAEAVSSAKETADGFAFLGADEPAGQADGGGTIEWLPPGGEPESAPPDDDKLGDFLKGLP